MKFPYGICDFQTIITEHYFYIDRTDKIPLIEQTGKQLRFLRPRRFGKSLLLSMLENYYDVTKAAQFETLFGHLAIGNHPTPWHNQYLVMKWDFSMVSCQGDLTTIQGALHDHLNSRIKAFATQYQDLLPQSIEIASHNAIASCESLLLAVRQTPYRLYLLIDEYDNFANELMMGTRLACRNLAEIPVTFFPVLGLKMWKNSWRFLRIVSGMFSCSQFFKSL